MALLCAAYGILFGTACFLSSPLNWYRLDVHTDSALRALKVFYPSLLLLLLLSIIWVVFMVSLNASVHGGKKLITQLSVVFSTMYSLLVSVNYYVQFVVVRQHVLTGNTSGLELVSQTNVYSIMSSIDLLGYFFLGVTMILISVLFPVKLRWLSILSGLSCISGLVGQVFQSTAILSSSAITMTAFPLFLFVALSIWLKRQTSELPSACLTKTA